MVFYVNLAGLNYEDGREGMGKGGQEKCEEGGALR